MNFKPGDMVLFDAAAVFKGTLKIGVDDSGSLGKPVVFTSYGGGKTTINAGGSSGMLVVNASNIVLANIKVVGDGVEKKQWLRDFFVCRRFASCAAQYPHQQLRGNRFSSIWDIDRVQRQHRFKRL